MAADRQQHTTTLHRAWSAASKSEMQDELHTLGNCLARLKMGTRLLARRDVSDERRHALAGELSDAIVEAESAFRLLAAQLK